MLPKALRDRLNLKAGAQLRAEVVAGRIELTPVADERQPGITRKGGIAVLSRSGVPVDAAAAIAGEREDSEGRGLKR